MLRIVKGCSINLLAELFNTGIRAQYHPNYYGAFVIGSDGHNIEAVCHRPEA